MKIIDIINEEFNNLSLTEEYDQGDNQLYGYHVTSKEKLQSIFDNGLRVGDRSMQGRGFYAFYDFNHALQYLMKGEVRNPVMVKFLVTCKECLLFLNMNIAKQVLGDKYHLKNQLQEYFKFRGGLEFVLEDARRVYDRNLTMGGLVAILDDIEVNNSEGNQRKLVFNLISNHTNDRLNLVWNGNYGLEYRVNYVNMLEPIGYFDYSSGENRGRYYNKPEKSLVPNTETYQELRDILADRGQIGSKLQLVDLKYLLTDKLYKVRNNRDYEYFQNLIDKINSLI